MLGRRVRRNVGLPVLVTETVRAGAGVLAEGGALVVDTGKKTGRSADDKFLVREPGSEARIWWGKVNKPLEPASFERLRAKVVSHLDGRDLYVVDAYAGADPAHRMALRVVTASAYHALFAQIMFILPEPEELAGFSPDALVLHAPEVEADPETDGTRSGTFIAVHPTRAEVLIGGTAYAGEIKKSIFTLMNDRLPLDGVFPMHCSANVGDGGDVAIFFGLSGTGKTTLSADPARHLIGDDEHGWGDTGVFNFEDGCYAKVIRLSAEAEPEIYATTHRFGTLLENVVIDDAGRLDLWSEEKTENTRGAYKLEAISNSLPAKRGGHPDNVVFLTADAFGGHAADRAAERAAGRVPLPLGLHREARRHRDRRHRAEPDLLTLLRRAVPAAAAGRLRAAPAREARSPTGRPCGSSTPAGPAARPATAGTGCRSPRRGPCFTRRSPAPLAGVEMRTDHVFGFEVPVQVPGVDTTLLDPRSTWGDPAAYDAKAQELASMFRENFERFTDVDPEVAAAGPVPSSAQAPTRSASVRLNGNRARRTRDRRGVRRDAGGDRGARRRRRRRGDLEAAPDPQPFRRGRGRHQRRARKRGAGLPRDARLRHGQGLRLPRRPGRGRDLRARGAGRHLRARALGRRVHARRRRAARAAAVRRRRLAAHGLRRRHHGPRPDPGALRAARQARHPGLRGVLRLEARRGRRPLPGRDRLGSPARRAAGDLRHARRSSPPAASGGSTASRRTPTRARATAPPWRSGSGCRSRTWSSCSSTRRRCTRLES